MKVGIINYNLIGKRVADAVTLQNDMRVVGIVEPEKTNKNTAELKGYNVYNKPNSKFFNRCDIIVNCDEKKYNTGVNTINIHNNSESSKLFASLSNFQDAFNIKELKIAEPNNIAITRILYAIFSNVKIKRLYASIVVRGAHATLFNNGPIDALKPIFKKPYEQTELEALLGKDVDIFIQQVLASYTSSNNIILKIDVTNSIHRDEIISLLQNSPRIIVAAGRDGFKDSAHIQEFYRDLGRPRFDRPEIFLWEENILVNQNSIYIMVDVSTEATIIPDIIDAIRLNKTNEDILNCIKTTDTLIGIKK
ncbi:hypothetical protein K9K77_02290 [Candidatus Babeliales bacterium]|nr:hypothetical protein [Candidatus Babeliales bacterium]